LFDFARKFTKKTLKIKHMSTIIYLNGPSSSGKTTLVKALQQALTEPHLCIGIDKIISWMPEKINDWTGGHAPLGFSWEKGADPIGPTDHPVFHIRSGPFAKRLARTLIDVAALLAAQNYNLIIDDISFGAPKVDEWRKALKSYKVLYVGVNAPLEILEQRERARGDRLIGGARGQFYKVHENVTYDLVIDTHKDSIESNVQKIKTNTASAR
jgi:chloramphenicol 3-O phosphotransferase